MSKGDNVDLRKYNPDGSRWFGECPPIPGLTPILEPLTEEQAKADYYETVEIRDRVAGMEPTDTPPEIWYTADDPEWVADVFEKYDVDPDPGPILRPVIERIAAETGVARAQAAGELVYMDKPVALAAVINDWAAREGLQAAKKFRRCEPPYQDVVSIGFHLPEFMLSGLSWGMDIIAAEKEWHERYMDERGFVFGWRPEMVAQHLAGVGAATTTPSAVGCPPMGPRPQGHSYFFAFLCMRAAMFLNGPGVDETLKTTGLHGGVYRVFRFVHSIREALEGDEIATRAAMGHFDDYRPRNL